MDALALKAAIRRSALTRWVARLQDAAELRAWRAKDPAGRPWPALLKRKALLAALRQGGIGQFVETGTLYGDTTDALARAGATVYSIEVEPRLASLARLRFKDRPNVHIVEGDSGVVMPDIVARLGDRPALFWLDGHFSGGVTGRGESDTPILKELAAILPVVAPGSVVFIDDARCFGTEPDYPTMAEIENFLARYGISQIALEGDLIRFTVPPRG